MVCHVWGTAQIDPVADARMPSASGVLDIDPGGYYDPYYYAAEFSYLTESECLTGYARSAEQPQRATS